MKKILIAIMICYFIIGCSPSAKMINFPTKEDERYANYNLKAFLRTNLSPSIVLRVPNTSDKATSNTGNSKDNTLLYNTIEKEFLKDGYSVRDRGLFNELLSKSQTSDYSKIKELTNTDLILEVVNIDPVIKYTTNKITSVGKKDSRDEVQSKEYTANGISAEFRLIMVKNNEIAGTYKFFYKPCPNGCELIKFQNTKRSGEVVLMENVSSNTVAMENFMKKCTKDLITSFANN